MIAHASTAMQEGGFFSPPEMAQEAAQALLAMADFRFMQAALSPDARGVANGDSDNICAAMTTNAPQALELFTTGGYSWRLKAIFEDFPGTPAARQAGEVFMHAMAAQPSWEDMPPEIKQCAADNAIPMTANTINFLETNFRANTQDKLAQMLVDRNSALLQKVASEGLWTPVHTAGLCKLLEQDSLYTPDVGPSELIMRKVAAHYHLPPEDHLKLGTNYETQDGRKRTARQLYLNRVAWLENTQAGAARTLRDMFGLRSFVYSTCDHLATMYFNRDAPPSRVSFALIPTPTANDYGFHADTLLIDKMHYEGPGDANWFIVQYETADELAARLDFMAAHFRFGDGPQAIQDVPLIAILGHGGASSIGLEGPVEAPTTVMTAEEVEAKIAPRLRRISTAGTTIVMSTCRAADKPEDGARVNLAEAVHRQTGRKVVAGEGYNVIEEIRFVQGAIGQATIDVAFAALQHDILGQQRWAWVGKYIYPARGYGATPPAIPNSESGPAPNVSDQ